MDFTLSRPQQMLRDMAREFAERELHPREDELRKLTVSGPMMCGNRWQSWA